MDAPTEPPIPPPPPPSVSSGQLIHRRCFHHANREAAAKCLECQRFYCRECVSEHAGQVLCRECIIRIAPTDNKSKKLKNFPGLSLLKFGVGLLICWYAFSLLGDIMLSLPSAFHEGRVLDTVLEP